MVSFDVKSLFTSIPQELALDSILDKIKNSPNLMNHTHLSPDEIIDLLKLCFEANFFQWNDQLYKQVYGTPMGSPISVVIAEFTMQVIEETILNNHPEITLWRRYVDDVFAIIPRSESNNILNSINTVNQSIQFTIEEEQHSTLPFLDILINRETDGKFIFSIYRKPSHTDQYLHYDSYHPTIYKNSVAKALFDRTKLCSDECKPWEIETIKKSLTMNNYPKNFIKKQQNRCLNSTSQLRAIPTDQLPTQPVKYRSAPYLRGTSERMQRALKPYGINLCHKSGNTIRSKLCTLKDKKQPLDHHKTIYRSDCNQCDTKYFGHTSKTVRDRVKQHEANVRTEYENSLIFKHVDETGHSFNLQGTIPIHRANTLGTRIVLEGIYSIMDPNSINRRFQLPEQYNPIIQNLKQ